MCSSSVPPGGGGESARLKASEGAEIFEGDKIHTGEGAAAVLIFADETAFSLGENAEMSVDEMAYDPAAETGGAVFSVAKGMFGFVSGRLAKTDPEAMVIETPSASVIIRGSSGAGDAAAEGEGGLFVLMPDPDGAAGEIIIRNEAGAAVMNQPYQTSSAPDRFVPPGAPVLLPAAVVRSVFGEMADALAGALAAADSAADPRPDRAAAEQAFAEALAAGASMAAALSAAMAASRRAAAETARRAEEEEHAAEAAPLNDAPAAPELYSGAEFSLASAPLPGFTGYYPPQFRSAPQDFFGGPREDAAPYTPVFTASAPPAVSVALTETGKEITGTDEADEIKAGGGDDEITGGGGDDKIKAGGGDDVIDGGAGKDDIDGGSGDDDIEGGGGKDIIDGGSGDDDIDGGAGSDDIKGGIGDDVIKGGGGDDEIDGGVGDDSIDGGAGNDIINADWGHDTVKGGLGDDTIDAGLGDDIIDGGAGDDTINAGWGDDIIIAGAGADIIEMSYGDDTLRFTDFKNGGHTVKDFGDLGGADKIAFFGLTLTDNNGDEDSTLDYKGGVTGADASARDLTNNANKDSSVYEFSGASWRMDGTAAADDAVEKAVARIGVDSEGNDGDRLLTVHGGAENIFILYDDGGGAAVFYFDNKNSDNRVNEDELTLLVFLEDVGHGALDASHFAFAADPLVFDLDGDGVRLTAPDEDGGARFDMDGDGEAEAAGWFSAGDALLVIDDNENGVIDGMGEVVSASLKWGGGKAEGAGRSLDALARFDDNEDGVIDEADAVWSVLQLWKDDGDGVTEEGELLSLKDFGITRIALDGRDAEDHQAGGAVHRKTKAETEDGGEITVSEVSFAAAPADPQPKDPDTQV